MTPQHDILLEIDEVPSRCLCGGHIRLYRDDEGELVVEHTRGLHCAHRNAIVLGLTKSVNGEAEKN